MHTPSNVDAQQPNRMSRTQYWAFRFVIPLLFMVVLVVVGVFAFTSFRANSSANVADSVKAKFGYTAVDPDNLYPSSDSVIAQFVTPFGQRQWCTVLFGGSDAPTLVNCLPADVEHVPPSLRQY